MVNFKYCKKCLEVRQFSNSGTVGLISCDVCGSEG
jgi:hypothetical protein